MPKLFTETSRLLPEQKAVGDFTTASMKQYKIHLALHSSAMKILEQLQMSHSISHSNGSDLLFMKKNSIDTLREEAKNSPAFLQSLKDFNRMLKHLNDVKDYLHQEAPTEPNVLLAFTILQEELPAINILLEQYNPLSDKVLGAWKPSALEQTQTSQPHKHASYGFPARKPR